MISRNVVAAGSVALLALVTYGVYLTDTDTAGVAATTTPASTASTLGDSTLAIAVRLTRQPTTNDELPYARDALRLADQDADLAFAAAVRQEAGNPQPISKDAQDIAERLQRMQLRELADSSLIARLAAVSAAASGTNRIILDSLSLVKARLQVDRDRIEDARVELADAGGDAQGRLQAMVAEHEAASRRTDSIRVNIAVPLDENGGLVQIARSFSVLRLKDIQLQRAIASSEAAAVFLQETQRARTAQLATDMVRRDSALARMGTRRPMAGRRSENQRRLASVYGKWRQIVKAQERALVNQALRSAAMILVIVLFWLFSDTMISRILATRRMDRRSIQRLRVVARVSLQAFGILLVLIVIFGTPNNLGTIIGLAGAGLTVALKDFIVSFVGWLVLMGKDGVRIGDLVEINGVTGEVVELGMFNTVLHETGNWTDAGHPTGRRVTFTNSYAIEGHYFNFSTSGQWLWDEVRIAVPTGKDPYRIVDSLQKHVREITAESTKLAEQEWKGASKSPALSTITAAPAITIKPILEGVEVTLRYITHAAERYELRSRLYHTAVDVLGEASTSTA